MDFWAIFDFWRNKFFLEKNLNKKCPKIHFLLRKLKFWDHFYFFTFKSWRNKSGLRILIFQVKSGFLGYFLFWKKYILFWKNINKKWTKNPLFTLKINILQPLLFLQLLKLKKQKWCQNFDFVSKKWIFGQKLILRILCKNAKKFHF